MIGSLTKNFAAALSVAAIFSTAPGVYGAIAEPPAIEVGLEMRYLGATVGEMTLKSDLAPEGGEERVAYTSTGLVWFFTELRGNYRAQYGRGAAGQLTPERFAFERINNRSDRRVEIDYGAPGAMPEVRSWKRGVAQDSQVPEDLWPNTIDPLTALLNVRFWLMAGAAHEAVLPVFDGRNRYDMRLRLLERGRFDLAHGEENAFRIRIELDPLAGFDPDDWMVEWSQEGAWIEAWVSDDGAFAPLYAEARGAYSSSIAWTRICTPERGCRERR